MGVGPAANGKAFLTDLASVERIGWRRLRL
jgi:hypothetical protein